MIHHPLPIPQNVKNIPKRVAQKNFSNFIKKKYKIQHENVFDFNCRT